MSTDTILHLSPDQLQPNPYQPRHDMGDLSELAASIGEHGILQPITAAGNDNGTFTIVAGHRRAAAAKLAGLELVPVILRHGAEAADRIGFDDSDEDGCS